MNFKISIIERRKGIVKNNTKLKNENIEKWRQY